MKKAISLLALLLSMSIILSACGSTGSSASSASPAADSAAPTAEASHDPETDPQFTTKDLLMGTSSSTSSYYTIGAGISDMMNSRGYKFTVSATTSGGAVDNLNRIASGEAELGIGIPDAVNEAANGTGDWEGKPVAVATLCSMWSNPLNIVVRADSGITSIADLAGKRVSTGAAGTGAQKIPNALLKAYGINPDDLTWANAAIGEQCSMLKDGQIDAIIMTMGTGNASLTDLAATTDVVWLSADEDIIKQISDESPFYCQVDIDVGTYPGIEDVVHCLGFKVNLYASTERVSDDQAYLIVKTIFENHDEISKYHSVGKDILLETALDGLACDLHPGAARYFQEKGMLD